jgi:hypothetical protein
VKAIETTQGPHPGVGFIPMGPWANSIIDPNTYSTGMPTFKGTPVRVEVAMNEPILLGIELVQKLCGVDDGICPGSHRNKPDARVRSLRGLDCLHDYTAVIAGDPHIRVFPRPKFLKI